MKTAFMQQRPVPAITPLHYATPAPFAAPRGWRALCVCHWAALVSCAVGVFVIWRFDVESGVLFGIPVMAAALTLIGGGEAIHNRTLVRLGVLHAGMCGLCFVLVVAFGWGPQEAREPLTIIGAVHTVVVTAASTLAGAAQLGSGRP